MKKTKTKFFFKISEQNITEKQKDLKMEKNEENINSRIIKTTTQKCT